MKRGRNPELALVLKETQNFVEKSRNVFEFKRKVYLPGLLAADSAKE